MPRTGKEKPAKVPVNPVTGGAAKTNDPSTWGSFEQAWSYYQGHRDQGVKGLGFVFSKDDPYAGIDLDNCRDPETGELNSFAREVLDRVNSYTEVSPSGKGFHIIVRGKLPGSGAKTNAIEIYDDGRYFTFTGNALPGWSGSVEERNMELRAVYREAKGKEGGKKPEAMGEKENSKRETKTKKSKAASQPAEANLGPEDARLIAKGKSRYGDKFVSLWDGDYGGYTEEDSQNEADLALSNYLSYLTKGDTGEVDRLFRLSGLMRDKWDEPHYSDGRTHGQATIELAIAGTLEAIEKQKTISMLQTTGASPSRDTDVGNGKRLVATCGKDLRYCHQMNTWLIWTRKRWQVDTTLKIMQYAKDTAAAIWREVDASADESRRRDLVRHAKASESHSKLKAMVACAQSEEEVAITLYDLDQNHMLFNCKNGTLDLRTGQFRPHRRQDLITKLAPVTYDSGAACPRWKQFMSEVMAEDQEKIVFLQKAAGYSLTGDTREQCLFDLWGQGANGKSTFLEILKAVIGQDYAYQAARDTFTQRGIGQIPHDLAGMRGSRLVTLPDFEKGVRLNEALIKQVTGGDQLSARHMYKGSLLYAPWPGKPGLSPLLGHAHLAEPQGECLGAGGASGTPGPGRRLGAGPPGGASGTPGTPGPPGRGVPGPGAGVQGKEGPGPQVRSRGNSFRSACEVW